MTKKKYVLPLIITIILTATLILGTIFDLQISKALCILPENSYYCQNFFTAFFEVFGETILYAILVCSFSILFCFFYKKNTARKTLKVIILVVCAVFGILTLLLCFYKTLNNAYNFTSPDFKNFFSYTTSKIFIVALSLLIQYLLILLFNKLQPQTLASLAKWAIVVLIVCALSNGIVQALKHIVHRTRFRTMLYVGDTDFSYFSNWFIINHNTFDSALSFSGDFFKSFPSGHACAAASIFTLCLLPNFLEKLNKKNNKIMLLIISIVYTSVVCLSRIMAGAHFFTDVVIGSVTTVLILFLTNLFYNRFLSKQLDRLDNF